MESYALPGTRFLLKGLTVFSRHALIRNTGLIAISLLLLFAVVPAPRAFAQAPTRDDKIVRNDGRTFEIQNSARTYSPSNAVTIDPRQLKNETIPPRKLLQFHALPNSIIVDENPPPNSVIGADGRTRVLDTTVFPYSAIVQLEVDFRFGSALCSGWMIGPDTVATAAHCLHYPGLGGWAQSITAYPGRDGALAPFGGVAALNWNVRQKWIDTQGPGHDYGVIQLADPIGNTVGYFGYQYNTKNQFYVGKPVTVSGYPGDKNGDEAGTQWMMDGQIDKAHKRRLFYSIDTYGGQSGSPLYGKWTRKECDPCAFGIHTYGVGGNWTMNSATRITKGVFNFLQSASAP